MKTDQSMTDRTPNKCGAKTRQGTPCQMAPIRGRTRCRKHGGMSLIGPESGTWKTGRYSKASKELVTAYTNALNDPELLSLHHEVALTDAQIAKRLENFDTNNVEHRLALQDLIAMRIRLVESERKRHLDMSTTMTADQAVALVSVVVDTVRKHVQDRKVMHAITDDLRQFLAG